MSRRGGNGVNAPLRRNILAGSTSSRPPADVTGVSAEGEDGTGYRYPLRSLESARPDRPAFNPEVPTCSGGASKESACCNVVFAGKLHALTPGNSAYFPQIGRRI